tara:strand:+ start:1677 stop:1916 length:240 start_codon:yes stop_codon:yes gene_type:complete
MLRPGIYSTQKTSILKHLKNHGELTPLDALEQYGCFRLAAVIHTLRQEGHRIKTNKMTRRGKTFASYKLEASVSSTNAR